MSTPITGRSSVDLLIFDGALVNHDQLFNYDCQRSSPSGRRGPPHTETELSPPALDERSRWLLRYYRLISELLYTCNMVTGTRCAHTKSTDHTDTGRAMPQDTFMKGTHSPKS